MSKEAPPTISISAIGVKTTSPHYYDPVTSSQEQRSRMATREAEVSFGPGGATVELITTGSSESGGSHHTSSADTSSDNDGGRYSYRCSDTIRNPRSSLNFYGAAQFVGLIQGSDSPSSGSSYSSPHPIQSLIIATANRTKRTRPSSRCLSTSHNYPTSANPGYTFSTPASSTSTNRHGARNPNQPPPHL
ncbi:hypothetical protein HOY80DRAFT_1103264 [Tuber brumale]|nr:hypothetical protein HOY80DRAFT_1103264 [Tuber brumale]